MGYLLDTSVLSEWVTPRPNPAVVRWLAEIDEDRVFLSVVTLAELRYGVERLAPGRRRSQLDNWLREQLSVRFEGRILPIDESVADAYARVVAGREARGRPIGVIDAFIAATTQVHELTLVTRNASDFESIVTATVNPWTEIA